MTGSVFLSAGIPDPTRGPTYAESADPVAITSAISAVVHVLLGRRILVFGGQPAITPMIWVMAEHMGIDYGAWIRLYQSLYFQDQFPEDNQKYNNTVFTSAETDFPTSLLTMRKQILSDFEFDAAIFIGGMKGIEEEFDLFQELQPKAKLLPISSTGGGALVVAQKLPDPVVPESLDYVMLLHNELKISPKEKRYQRPDLQPSDIASRMWQVGDAP